VKASLSPTKASFKADITPASAIRVKKIAKKAARQFEQARASYVHNLRSVEKLITSESAGNGDDDPNEQLYQQQQQTLVASKLADDKLMVDRFLTFAAVLLAELVTEAQGPSPQPSSKSNYSEPPTPPPPTSPHARRQSTRDNIAGYLDTSTNASTGESSWKTNSQESSSVNCLEKNASIIAEIVALNHQVKIVNNGSYEDGFSGSAVEMGVGGLSGKNVVSSMLQWALDGRDKAHTKVDRSQLLQALRRASKRVG